MSISADWVEAIGTWVAAIVIVGSLWFLWLQIRDLRRSIRSSTYQNVYQLMIDIDRFFVENPNLKQYFYDGKELDTTEQVNREKLFSIAEMLVDYFDNVYYQQDCLPANTFDAFIAFMRDIYRNSPVLREFLSSREHWYPKKFVEDLRGVCKTWTNSG